MSRRVALQRSGDARDSIGGVVKQWRTVATVWADIRFLSGLEAVKSDASVSVAKASIRIRYRTDVDAACRVLSGTRVFDVKAVLPDEAGHEFVDLVCDVGASNG